LSATRVAVAHHPEELRRHAAAWEDLAASALEPNVFYEPWMLLPAVELFPGPAPLSFVFIYAGEQLCAFFPIEHCARYRGLPVRHVRLWRHKHCFLRTPLVRRTQARPSLVAFLDWLDDTGDAAFMEWGTVSADGPFWQLLEQVLDATGRRSVEAQRFSRALLRPRRDAEDYLRAALPGKSRKEYRRLERRLAESGGIAYATLEGDPQDGIEAFLRLEAGGWKGRQGSALACAPGGAHYFRTIAREAARRGRLMMLSLALAGRPIAMKCNFLAADGAGFSFKIAHDERYARWSPGVLLELRHIADFHRRALEWMDSCAEPDHFMANRLWLDRRSIAKLLTATGRASGELFLSTLPFLQRVAGVLRRAA
jgi:CelD/BcsL family acetyltransferase involved in cellulose biosynthesis